MTILTPVHVLISLVAILSGLIVARRLLKAESPGGWTMIFLSTTVLTSATGFLFPEQHFTPGQGVGILSLIVLAIAIVARYPRHLEGGWKRTYAITSIIALYFNCFVLVVQAFEKVAVLHALAPTQSEPPFAIAQLILMGLFIWWGVAAAKRFHNPPSHMARTATAS